MVEVQELRSATSLSVQLWKEALEKRDLCRNTADNILFMARDSGSLLGLRRHHGDIGMGIGFTAITPDKARLFFDLGMKFRFAYLIEPSPEIVEGIKPTVTELLVIARRETRQKALLI